MEMVDGFDDFWLEPSPRLSQFHCTQAKIRRHFGKERARIEKLLVYPWNKVHPDGRSRLNRVGAFSGRYRIEFDACLVVRRFDMI